MAAPIRLAFFILTSVYVLYSYTSILLGGFDKSPINERQNTFTLEQLYNDIKCILSFYLFIWGSRYCNTLYVIQHWCVKVSMFSCLVGFYHLHKDKHWMNYISSPTHRGLNPILIYIKTTLTGKMITWFTQLVLNIRTQTVNYMQTLNKYCQSLCICK